MLRLPDLFAQLAGLLFDDVFLLQRLNSSFEKVDPRLQSFDEWAGGTYPDAVTYEESRMNQLQLLSESL